MSIAPKLKRLIPFAFWGILSTSMIASGDGIEAVGSDTLIFHFKMGSYTSNAEGMPAFPVRYDSSDQNNSSNIEKEFMEDNPNDFIDAFIVGSAESPDPVLAEVMKLEKTGMVKEVRILESFPVQIHLKAPTDIIERLKKIPRKKGGLY